MSNKGHIPATPVVNKQTRFDALVARLCEFIALTDRAHVKLRQQRRITPQQEFKLVTEMSFARGVVLHMAGLSQVEYQGLVTKVQQHPDFEKSADVFCDDFVPPKKKLITVGEFTREQLIAKGRHIGAGAAPRGPRG